MNKESLMEQLRFFYDLYVQDYRQFVWEFRGKMIKNVPSNQWLEAWEDFKNRDLRQYVPRFYKEFNDTKIKLEDEFDVRFFIPAVRDLKGFVVQQ